MLEGQIPFISLVFGAIIAMFITGKIIDLIVQLIRQTRKAIQFVIMVSIIMFFILVSIAPEETGQLVRLIINMFKAIVGAILAFLEIATEHEVA